MIPVKSNKQGLWVIVNHRFKGIPDYSGGIVIKQRAEKTSYGLSNDSKMQNLEFLRIKI